MPDVTARIYLDNCALNRPWDDQSQIRIHREAESVLFLIEEARSGSLELVSCDYLFQEITETADAERQRRVIGLLDATTLHVAASTSLLAKSAAFSAHAIRGFDALHLAAAIEAKVTAFITTDDRLLKRCRRAGSLLPFPVINPTDWPLSHTTP